MKVYRTQMIEQELWKELWSLQDTFWLMLNSLTAVVEDFNRINYQEIQVTIRVNVDSA